MKTQAIDAIFDRYSAQRRDRATRQKHILIKLSNFQHSLHPPTTNPSPNQPSLTPQQFDLVKQNHELKKTLLTLQQEERVTVLNMQVQVDNIKNKYVNEIQTIMSNSTLHRKQTEKKICQQKERTEAALRRTEEAQTLNDRLKNSNSEATTLMNTYDSQIRAEYERRLVEFTRIAKTSEDRLAEMEQSYEEDQFIQHVLNNQDFMQSVQQRAQKGSQANQMLTDFHSLLASKILLLNEINSNNEQKQKQIDRLLNMQTRIKTIIEKIEQEVKHYLGENAQMHDSLSEIGALLQESLDSQHA